MLNQNEKELLYRINSNADLRAVPERDIPELCRDIREFLVENVSHTGGHLASNLGSVELTVALHRVYDPMKDRILFDVGHQSYVHKILTGRRDSFDTLRQLDGVSGFPKPCESNADPFLAGHASDSVSLAAGMARARTLMHGNYDVVAVVGDGAMTGGLCFEGLSDLGASREAAVVVLNDNGMSINENVGGVARLLRRARTRPGYLRFKRTYRRVMKKHPHAYEELHRLKERIKAHLLPSGIFDDLGFYYIGPVDGHDEKALETTLRWAKDLHRPVVVHVVTVKGKGYAPAEADPQTYHGVNPFDRKTGVTTVPANDFSAAFGASAIALAEKDPTVCAVTAAMEHGTGLSEFARRFPNRYFELGIAEEHAAAMCAGMAKQGLTPIFAVYSTFLQRSYDMLIENIGLMGLHVVLAVDRAGLVGRDGVTHQGSFDIAYLGSVPNMTVYAPASFCELDSMLSIAVREKSGPVALRYPRGGEGAYTDDHSREDSTVLRSGGDVTIVTYGISVNAALAAAETLSADGIRAEVIKLNRLLPLAPETVRESLRKPAAPEVLARFFLQTPRQTAFRCAATGCWISAAALLSTLRSVSCSTACIWMRMALPPQQRRYCMKKIRLDQLVFDKGLAESRERAKAYIMAGSVYVNGQKETKPGTSVAEDAAVEMRGETLPYVSRGGWKLEKALRVFPIDVKDAVCIDCGASTGGFTDVLLQSGAAKVYAVDVGYGQLAWSLRTDPRVVCMERTNIRYVTHEQIPEEMDVAVADLSFISLRLILSAVGALLKPEGEMVCLVKPQFEAGKDKVGKKGVVRDPAVHAEVLREFLRYAPECGFGVRGLDFSPIRGPEGNIEYLAWLKKGAESIPEPDIDALVAASHAAHGKDSEK